MKKRLIAVLVLAATTLISCASGDGRKVGQIVKLSKQGIVNDTWEAQLIRGGMQGGSGSFGVQPFDFTITDERLLPAVRAAFEGQYEVVITYHIQESNAFFHPMLGDTMHYLTQIERFDPKKAQ